MAAGLSWYSGGGGAGSLYPQPPPLFSLQQPESPLKHKLSLNGLGQVSCLLQVLPQLSPPPGSCLGLQPGSSELPHRQHCPFDDGQWTTGSSEWGREPGPGSGLPKHDRCPRMPAYESQPLGSGQAPGSLGLAEGHLATGTDMLGAEWGQVSPPSVSHITYCFIFK